MRRVVPRGLHQHLGEGGETHQALLLPKVSTGGPEPADCLPGRSCAPTCRQPIDRPSGEETEAPEKGTATEHKQQ